MRVASLLLSAVTVSTGALYQIDQPTPLSLAHAEYCVGARVWGEGGVMVRFAVGLFDRVTLGMSYSADRILGAQTPSWARARPEFSARVAILQEQGYVPDLALGFESQGLDRYEGGRFQVKEKGGYLCAGKTIDASRTYCEAGVNYWQGVDGFVAVNQLLPGGLELLLEYCLGANDDADAQFGFLNAGVAYNMAEQFRLVLALRDILGNRGETRLNRAIDLSFRQHF